MKVLISCLLVIACFLCVMNVNSDTGLGQYTSFNLMDLFEWFSDTIESAPTVFSDWESETDTFWDNFIGTLADIGSLFTFPIRFILWLVPVLIDFVSTFLLPGVSF